MISKERCIHTAEKEILSEDTGTKLKADPVFFISLVGVNDEGIVDKDEYIFDVYTKHYDFLGSNVQVISAQDLWSFYKARNNGADKKKINIYQLVDFFVL